MIKRYILNFVFLYFGTLASAQLRPHYTQYILNNYVINPAVTGIENYVDIKLSARNQWVGVEGAPRTYYLTAHMPLGKGDYRQTSTSFDLVGQNTRGNEFVQSYTAASPHHGVGITAFNYSTGYINRITSYATYAYHIGLNASTSLSAGFGAGFTSFSIDRSKVTLATDQDPAVDQSLAAFKRFKPELNAGIWLYSNRYFVGISAQQIIPSKLTLMDNAASQSSMVPHIFTTAGYRTRVSFDVTLLPSIMFRYVAGLPMSVDVNLKAQFLDVFWVGGSYRNGDGFAGMCGLNLSRKFHVSYSYDLNKGKYLLSTMNRGTHEIVLGFMLNNRFDEL
ncbi:MAG: type IX secretion system membrane protein PorP/SprF [Bacteroidetes bacterium]|nr:type IX secretion system membrane protein PorP/SprF [Bacteroidota bacterium]